MAVCDNCGYSGRGDDVGRCPDCNSALSSRRLEPDLDLEGIYKRYFEELAAELKAEESR